MTLRAHKTNNCSFVLIFVFPVSYFVQRLRCPGRAHCYYLPQGTAVISAVQDKTGEKTIQTEICLLGKEK